MLAVLKIPLVYLAAVLWWAIRADLQGPAGGRSWECAPRWLHAVGTSGDVDNRSQPGSAPNRPSGRMALRLRGPL